MDDNYLVPLQEQEQNPEHIMRVCADIEGLKTLGKEMNLRLFLEKLDVLYNQFTDDIGSLGKEQGFYVKVETELTLNNK